MNFWKSLNWIVLAIQIIIAGLGTFYKHISFGAGLGDLFWYGLIYGLLILHLILTIRSKRKGTHRFIFLSIFFFLTTTLICLKATIWRGAEYRWNGNVFYENSSDTVVEEMQ
jgi:hypothetical protein